MSRRDWKHARASSLREAIDLSLEHARVRYNRSVDRVADYMGLATKWPLYKWMENSRLPANLIPALEHACGVNYVTEYLVQAAHKMMVPMPSGRAVSQMDMAELQMSFAEAVNSLARHYEGKADAETTIAAITRAMAGLAWQRENLAKSQAPELDLFPIDEEMLS